MSASIRLCRRSKPSVLEVRADTARPQAEPATCPGNTSTPSPSPASRSMQRVVEALGSLAAADREIGTRDIADEQRVAGQEDPGIVAALEVGDRDAAVLGAMARRVQDVERDLSEHDAIAVDDRPERVGGPAERMRRDPRAERRREDAVARDVVGVRVRLDHAHEPEPVALARVEHGLHVQRGVDDDRPRRCGRSPRRRRRSRGHGSGSAPGSSSLECTPGAGLSISQANARYSKGRQGARSAPPRSSAGTRGGGTGSRSRATPRARSARPCRRAGRPTRRTSRPRAPERRGRAAVRPRASRAPATQRSDGSMATSASGSGIAGDPDVPRRIGERRRELVERHVQVVAERLGEREHLGQVVRGDAADVLRHRRAACARRDRAGRAR